MSKKMMLLAAGVLAALAFTALPSIASAGEFNATCSSGATCTGTVQSTGHATLESSGGLQVTCTSVTGSTSQTNNSSTGSANLVFHGCTESVFGTSCGTGGTITANSMVSHLVYLEHDKSVKGILLTNANVTFSCFGGFVKKTVTGSIIGEIENPSCGVAKTHHTINFEAGATTGSQKWTKITTTGTVYDLISNNHAGGAYETSSQTGTAHINYNEGKSVTLDC
jgi:hypothetical protein